MKATHADINWLGDVSVFEVNRLNAYSDHRYYRTMEEAKASGAMAMRYNLNGTWKFNYAIRPDCRPEAFYKQEFSSAGWDDIEVPGHIQLQGYGQIQYVIPVPLGWIKRSASTCITAGPKPGRQLYSHIPFASRLAEQSGIYFVSGGRIGILCMA